MPAEAEAIETEEVEYFGDAPETDDLTELDRGDSVEEITEPDPEPTPEEVEVEPETTEEPPAEPPVEEEDSDEGDGPVLNEEPEEEAPASPPSAQFIPKQRLDVQIAKTRELERRLGELEESVEEPEVPAFDVATKTKEEYEAVIRGDLDAAATIRMEISANLAAQQKAQMQEVATNAASQSREQVLFEDKVSTLTAEYPIFDPAHKSFDESLLGDVLFKRDAYTNAGMPVTEALEMATREVAQMHGVGGLDTPPDEEPVEPPVASNGLAEKEQKQVVKKKIEAAAAQPPEIHGESSASHGTSKYDFSQMPEADFDALPESVIRRYRGD